MQFQRFKFIDVGFQAVLGVEKLSQVPCWMVIIDLLISAIEIISATMVQQGPISAKMLAMYYTLSVFFFWAAQGAIKVGLRRAAMLTWGFFLVVMLRQ